MSSSYKITDIVTSGIGDNSIVLIAEVEIGTNIFQKQFPIQLVSGLTLAQVKTNIDTSLRAFIAEEERKLAIIDSAGPQILNKLVVVTE